MSYQTEQKMSHISHNDISKASKISKISLYSMLMSHENSKHAGFLCTEGKKSLILHYFVSLIYHEWLSDSGYSRISETIYLEWMVLYIYMYVHFFVPFFKSLICHCVKYHFFIQFGMRKKLGSFEICASPVLTQNEDNWNFHSSLTLNKGKPI